MRCGPFMVDCHNAVGWYYTVPGFIHGLLIFWVWRAVYAAVPLELAPANVWGCELYPFNIRQLQNLISLGWNSRYSGTFARFTVFSTG